MRVRNFYTVRIELELHPAIEFAPHRPLPSGCRLEADAYHDRGVSQFLNTQHLQWLWQVALEVRVVAEILGNLFKHACDLIRVFTIADARVDDGIRELDVDPKFRTRCFFTYAA